MATSGCSHSGRVLVQKSMRSNLPSAQTESCSASSTQETRPLFENGRLLTECLRATTLQIPCLPAYSARSFAVISNRVHKVAPPCAYSIFFAIHLDASTRDERRLLETVSIQFRPLYTIGPTAYLFCM